MKQHSVYVPNLPLAEAKRAWREALTQAGFFDRKMSETIEVDEALGRLSAEAVFARSSSPPYNAAAMDGIAVDFKDTATASEANPVCLDPERFQPVNTGNAIPAHFNAVIMIEEVHHLENGDVEVITPATPWQHVRTVGEDIVATELIIPEGSRIRPIDQGAMLAAGVTEVLVRRQPKVYVIPTGSELIQPGRTAKPGQIIEFNSRILAGYLREWGAEVTVCPAVDDSFEQVKAAVIDGVQHADIVITNAGASAGTEDYSTTVLAALGTVVVHGVAIKPGKPVILALIDDTPVVGLPGYPVSAVLTLHLFARELIDAFLGRETAPAPTLEATMSRPMHSPMGVDQFIRVTLGMVGDTLIATPAGKGAGSVMSLVRADGLLTIPAGSEGIGAGERVSVEMLRDRAEVESTLVMIGSHDNILDLLADHLHCLKPPLRLSSAHVGSMGGIMAVKRGEAHLAGSHLLDEISGEYNISFIKRFLPDIELVLINLCYREQGLLVPAKNPKRIRGFPDIAEHSFSFINRQKGAGTRLLTEALLRKCSLHPSRIQGYDREEYTHMNVAAAVAAGSADTGMGIKAAATALGLDFVPLAEERYDLIIPKRFISDHRVEAVFDLLHDRTFQDKINALGGYNLRDCGKELYRQ